MLYFLETTLYIYSEIYFYLFPMLFSSVVLPFVSACNSSYLIYIFSSFFSFIAEQLTFSW